MFIQLVSHHILQSQYHIVLTLASLSLMHDLSYLSGYLRSSCTLLQQSTTTMCCHQSPLPGDNIGRGFLAQVLCPSCCCPQVLVYLTFRGANLVPSRRADHGAGHGGRRGGFSATLRHDCPRLNFSI